MTLLPFTKMQGLGNDFLVLDDVLGHSPQGELTPQQARFLCDRRLGVGADQVLWLKAPLAPKQADLRMEIWNADGSRAEMCGNGIRAVALYFHTRVQAKKPIYRIETLAGILSVAVQGMSALVDMGEPRLGLESGEEIQVAGRSLRFFEVGMGNPHAVFFVKGGELPMGELGPLIERHPRFPGRTNVEFVEILDPGAIRVRVWERGAGITLACGTGACASAVAAKVTGRVGPGSISVHLPGGKLAVSWDGPGCSVRMEGPALEVFRGEIFLEPV